MHIEFGTFEHWHANIMDLARGIFCNILFTFLSMVLWKILAQTFLLLSSILSNFDNIPVGKHFNNYGIVKTNAKIVSLLIFYSFSFNNKTQFHFKSWSKIIPIASKKGSYFLSEKILTKRKTKRSRARCMNQFSFGVEEACAARPQRATRSVEFIFWPTVSF